ncbi:MAG TPA: GPW/gp25 family protein [Nannocystaceae bacterium]|nr:GPW/gp25 family protein [Nannocystaceae bacterium]
MPISHPFRIDTTGRTATTADARQLVRELIEQVLFTRPGERVMRPTFGSGVHALVFAPATDEVAAIAQHVVQASLQQWLAEWIEIRNVAVVAEGASLTITVAYVLRRDGQRDEIAITRDL